jgi:hypothetical protein
MPGDFNPGFVMGMPLTSGLPKIRLSMPCCDEAIRDAEA